MEAHTHLEMSTLIRDHGHDLQQFLTRRLGCTETAKDLVQDTFLRLLQNRSGEVLTNPFSFASPRSSSSTTIAGDNTARP